MARRKKANGHADAPAAAAGIGHNGDDAERLRKFEREYSAAKAKVDEARGALGSLCKQAESDGIDVKTFKQVLKVKQLLAPEMQAKIETFTRYTTQLGLFDAIEAWRQAEAHEANAASVDAAEKTKGAPMAPADAAALRSFPDAVDQTPGGATVAAAEAQGQLAAESGAPRSSNPYRSPRKDAEHIAWNRGHDKAIAARGSVRDPSEPQETLASAEA